MKRGRGVVAGTNHTGWQSARLASHRGYEKKPSGASVEIHQAPPSPEPLERWLLVVRGDGMACFLPRSKAHLQTTSPRLASSHLHTPRPGLACELSTPHTCLSRQECSWFSSVLWRGEAFDRRVFDTGLRRLPTGGHDGAADRAGGWRPRYHVVAGLEDFGHESERIHGVRGGTERSGPMLSRRMERSYYSTPEPCALFDSRAP